MTNIVINYRRDDIPTEARRVRDALAARLGASQVIMASPYAPARPELSAGDALVVIIGPRWLELMQEIAARGERDEVRAEIATALRRGLTVHQVRVGAVDRMPAPLSPEELPEDIRALALTRPRIVALERIDSDAVALAEVIRPTPLPVVRERMPGNSMFKMWVWAAGVMGATVLFANLLGFISNAYYATTANRPGSAAAPASPRPSVNLNAWTGESRIRRAIEAALAKGKRAEDARRCQSQLISVTDSGAILFATASADLDQRSYLTLDRLAGIIKDCPDFIVDVEGHTDNMGEPANNQRLSERRAAAVRDYLVRAGVPTSSLTAAGYGETRPVAPNDTAENMARNRRIEFNITAR